MGKQNILMWGKTPRTLTLPPLPKLEKSSILINKMSLFACLDTLFLFKIFIKKEPDGYKPGQYLLLER